MDYKVAPGLYAVGDPTPDSPVLATANYKLTFDVVRRDCAGIDAWLLVLDTHGINVWCAAGKGTFGSKELVRRLRDCRVADVVSHRTVVVPQLGATGVAAYEVRMGGGFRVKWGPVRSSDLPAYLAADMRATPEMRAVEFPMAERAKLVPVELVSAMKPALPLVLALLAVALLRGGLALGSIAPHGAPAAWSSLVGVVGGAVAAPLLLPWLPGRAFSLKGLVTGALLGALLATLARVPLGIGAFAAVLTAGTIASYVAMNFTGSTPFTSLSGVDREMRRWIPLQALGAVLAAGLWVASAVLGGGM